METLSLLKYWKGAGGGCSAAKRPAAETTPADTGAGAQAAVEAEEDANDDGPFFDLEFDAVPGEGDGDGGEELVDVYGGEDGSEGGGRDEGDQYVACDDDDDKGEEEKQDDDLSSRSACDGSPRDRSLSLSPSDDLFFKGKLVPLDSSASSPLTLEDSEANLKNQFHASLLKPATKLRVFMLRFKKSKTTVMGKPDPNTSAAAAAPKPEIAAEAVAESSPRRRNRKEQSKFVVVKFKVEEVPIVSLFTREGSSRTSTGAGNGEEKQSAGAGDLPAADESASEEKRFSKDVLVQKYLKAIKPLYVRASKKYAEKLKLSGMLKLGSGLNLKCGAAPAAVAAAAGETNKESPPASRKIEEEANVLNLRNIPAGFRVVRKRLGKSRSASAASAVAAAPSKRRDDTLLEQEDGIQSAILHCKKSFNGSSSDSESTHLSRSSSEPSPEVMSGEPAADSGKAAVD